ncbi:MAG: ester cyclase [Gloeotrichia echinulata DVL01]|jgi:predicted ester cyclase|nr:ester cyclase [Gloeotrichia echinulata DEX184]
MNNLTNKEVVRLFFEIYNNQDYEASYKYIAPDYIDHGLPQVRSVEDAIEILKTTHKAFPDIKVVIDDLIEENDKIVFRGHFTGTHLGEFINIAPTGVKVEFEALEIFKIENQKITESWGYWPIAAILQTLSNN